jgi:hypothetical protein
MRLGKLSSVVSIPSDTYQEFDGVTCWMRACQE